MTCEELDRFLSAYLDGEFEPQERLEVEGHLASCAACARRVHEGAQLRAALRQAARAALEIHRAPEGLRSSVQAALLREQRRALQGMLIRAGAMVLVVAAAGGTWIALLPEQRQRFVEDAAKRHAKGLPYEISHASPQGIEAWFGGKLDHRVPVPELPNTTVAGARLSNVKDRPAAYISYETRPVGSDAPPRRIGLFVFDDAQQEIEAGELSAVKVGSSHGYNVAVWRDGEIVYELVSDLDEKDIRSMLAHEGLRRPPAPSPSHPVAPSVPVQPASLQR